MTILILFLCLWNMFAEHFQSDVLPNMFESLPDCENASLQTMNTFYENSMQTFDIEKYHTKTLRPHRLKATGYKL